MSRTPLDHALELAQQGYKVLFCKFDKSPTCLGGFYRASDDAGVLFDLYWLCPGPLVAIATGAASGIDVLDIDVKYPEAREWWRINAGRLPCTRAHRTRSGGIHLLFQHCPRMRISASRIARGVDVRADGGHAIFWPAAGLPVLCNALPAVWPEWLAALALVLVTTARRLDKPILWQPRGPISGYGYAALRRAIERILNASNGRQEYVINREAFSIGTLVGRKIIRKEDAYRDLLAIADQVLSLDPLRPWASGEVRRKIERGLTQGMKHPRAHIAG